MTTTAPIELRFGFLTACEKRIVFDQGSIEPLSTTAKAVAYASTHFNDDGYIYPEIVASYRGWPDEPTRREDMVPGSERQDSKLRTPATHKLIWTGQAVDQYRHLPSIAIQLLANWFGVALQFSDWWSFRRLRWKVSREFYGSSADQQEAFAIAMRNASKLSPDNTKRLVSLLSLLNSVHDHYLHWESFAWAYTCLDSAWAILKDLKLVSQNQKGTPPHKDRMKIMCDDLKMPYDPTALDLLVRLRNDLMHEARWDGAPPGEQSSDAAFLASYELHRLVTRLVFFILDVRCMFRTSDWVHDKYSGTALELGLSRVP